MTMPQLRSVYLFVARLEPTIDFYSQLGFEVERVSHAFARTVGPNGVLLEFGTAELTRSYDPGWQAPGAPAKNTINIEFESARAVDDVYRRLVGNGYAGRLAPCDPPWQARFAIVEDPDGNHVGLHGPRDVGADRRREHGDP